PLPAADAEAAAAPGLPRAALPAGGAGRQPVAGEPRNAAVAPGQQPPRGQLLDDAPAPLARPERGLPAPRRRSGRAALATPDPSDTPPVGGLGPRRPRLRGTGPLRLAAPAARARFAVRLRWRRRRPGPGGVARSEELALPGLAQQLADRIGRRTAA